MPWKDRWQPIFIAFPALLAPVIIRGGIDGGATTPTEAGGVACVFGLFVGFFVYRELEVESIREDKAIVGLNCNCTKQDGTVVATGKATVIAPKEKISTPAPALPTVTIG